MGPWRERRAVGQAADGTPLKRTLFLCADNGRGNPTLENTPGAIAGPEIPCTPAVLLVQKLARRKLLGEACDALRPRRLSMQASQKR